MSIEEYKKKTSQIIGSMLELKITQAVLWAPISPIHSMIGFIGVSLFIEEIKRERLNRRFLRKHKPVAIMGHGTEYFMGGMKKQGIFTKKVVF